MIELAAFVLSLRAARRRELLRVLHQRATPVIRIPAPWVDDIETIEVEVMPMRGGVIADWVGSPCWLQWPPETLGIHFAPRARIVFPIPRGWERLAALVELDGVLPLPSGRVPLMLLPFFARSNESAPVPRTRANH